MQVRHISRGILNNIQLMFRFHQDTEQAINGGIEFGAPSNIMFNNFQTVPQQCININGILVNVPNSGAANTQFIIIHNLNKIPIAAEIKRTNVTGILIDSGTAWTSTQIFLKFSGANARLTLFIH